MEAHRIFIKLYLDDASKVTAHDVVPVFHRWIQDRALDEVLVDVADYTHVHEGPGTLLICHAANYGFDLGEGRPGLIYSRKREVQGSWEERVRTAFKAVLTAGVKLEQEAALAGRFKVSTREMLFRINDRLLAPNAAQTFTAVEPGLRVVLGAMFGEGAFELMPGSTPDEPFSVRIRSSGDATAAELLAKL